MRAGLDGSVYTYSWEGCSVIRISGEKSEREKNASVCMNLEAFTEKIKFITCFIEFNCREKTNVQYK